MICNNYNQGVKFKGSAPAECMLNVSVLYEENTCIRSLRTRPRFSNNTINFIYSFCAVQVNVLFENSIKEFTRQN